MWRQSNTSIDLPEIITFHCCTENVALQWSALKTSPFMYSFWDTDRRKFISSTRLLLQIKRPENHFNRTKLNLDYCLLDSVWKLQLLPWKLSMVLQWNCDSTQFCKQLSLTAEENLLWNWKISALKWNKLKLHYSTI